MITAFVIAVIFTLGVSALCSVMEAMILSTRSIEIDRLKVANPRAGLLLERLRLDLEGTIASILTVNTVANTLGSVIVGALATKAFGDFWLGVVSAGMTLGILFLSEIFPKNIGVLYRTTLQPLMVYPLYGLCRMSSPLTDISTWVIRKVLRRPVDPGSEGEIVLMAEREAKEGRMSDGQLRLIRSSLQLYDATVEDIMTPRNVVFTCEATEKIGELFGRLGKFQFARFPVTGDDPDDIIGVARRKDLLHAIATGQVEESVRSVMQSPVIVPEIGKLSSALELMLSEHQQLSVVVDEFGGFAGVLTLEDIFEFLIGKEFYERDDVAVDMQELARKRSKVKRREISGE